MSKKFIEIVAEYPATCTYPEFKGKPYFSIRYEENGEKFEGFGTYKPEVLSGYISEYFMGADGAERKRGKWILSDEQRQEDVSNDNFQFICSECGKGDLHSKAVTVSFCWNCGADMRKEKTDE